MAMVLSQNTDELGRAGLLQRKTSHPNLYKVVAELAKAKDPYKTARRLLSILESCPENFADADKNVGLAFRDILTTTDKT